MTFRALALYGMKMIDVVRERFLNGQHAVPFQHLYPVAQQQAKQVSSRT